MVEENAGQDGKRFIIQIVRTDCCYLYIDFPEGEEGSMEKALEEARDLNEAGLIKESEWENTDGYQYFVVQQYSEDNSF